MSTSSETPCGEFREWDKDKNKDRCGRCGWMLSEHSPAYNAPVEPKRKFSLGWIGKGKPVEREIPAMPTDTQTIRIDHSQKKEPMRATVKVTNKYDPNKCANTKVKERRRKQMARDRWNNGEVYSVGTLTMHA